jgi:tetratricopeptide (TPR) repeat protein
MDLTTFTRQFSQRSFGQRRSRCIRAPALLLLTAWWFVTFAAQAQTDESAAKPRGKPDVKAWRKNREEGQKAMAQGKEIEAESFYEAALAEAEKFDSKDVRLAESLTDLGFLRFASQDYASAETLFGRAVTIRRGELNRLLEAQCLLYHALACRNLEKYDEAERDLLEAQDIVDRKAGPDHPDDAIIRYHLARVYEAKKDYSKAEPLLVGAVEDFVNPPPQIKVKQRLDPALYGPAVIRYTYRPNYQYALDGLDSLASIYVKLNQPDKAEKCYLKSVKVARDSNASELMIQSAELNLGSFYGAQKNYPKAQEMLERLEHAQEKSPGFNHPLAQQTLAKLGRVYEGEDRLSEAEATYKKAAAAFEHAAGPPGQDALSACGGLAEFYMRHERYADAATTFEGLWERAQKSRPDDVRDLPTLTQLAAVYQKLGRDDGLAKVYQQQIATYGKTFGPSSKALLKPLDNYAELLRKQKQDSEAKTIEARANAIRGAGAQ